MDITTITALFGGAKNLIDIVESFKKTALSKRSDLPDELQNGVFPVSLREKMT
jgi:hypothetical protein